MGNSGLIVVNSGLIVVNSGLIMVIHGYSWLPFRKLTYGGFLEWGYPNMDGS